MTDAVFCLTDFCLPTTLFFSASFSSTLTFAKSTPRRLIRQSLNVNQQSFGVFGSSESAECVCVCVCLLTWGYEMLGSPWKQTSTGLCLGSWRWLQDSYSGRKDMSAGGGLTFLPVFGSPCGPAGSGANLCSWGQKTHTGHKHTANFQQFKWIL